MTLPPKAFSLTKQPSDDKSDPAPLFFLRTFQELASLHATELGVSAALLSESNLAWMLHRLRVQFYDWGSGDDYFHFESYPSGFHRMLATRDFIAQNQEGKIVLRATSAWLIANTEKRRAIPIPGWIQERAPPFAPPILEFSGRRVLKREQELPTVANLRVEETDIDFLNHVNNTRYAHWILQHIPNDFAEKHELHELDILFKSEARLNDQLQIEQQQDANTMSHRIRNTKDQTELIQAKTHWKRKK